MAFAYLKTGVAGFASEKNLSSGRKEETNSQNPGLAFAVGIGYEKALNKKLN